MSPDQSEKGLSRRRPHQLPPVPAFGTAAVGGRLFTDEVAIPVALLLFKTSRSLRLWIDSIDSDTPVFPPDAYARRLELLEELHAEDDLRCTEEREAPFGAPSGGRRPFGQLIRWAGSGAGR